MSLKSAKPPPKSLPGLKCAPDLGAVTAQIYLAGRVLRVAVINTARTIVAKNGERAGSRALCFQDGVAAARRDVCVRACVRATPTGLRSNGDKVVAAKRARFSGASGPEEGRAGGGHGEGEAL